MCISFIGHMSNSQKPHRKYELHIFSFFFFFFFFFKGVIMAINYTLRLNGITPLVYLL